MKRQRYWFAPGPVPMAETIRIEYSHRSSDFVQLYLSTVAMLEDWTKRKVVLIQGSASAAIESVLEGMGLAHKRVLVVNNGSFAQRVVDRLNRIGFSVDETETVAVAFNLLLDTTAYQAVYVVQFETSNSTLNQTDELGALCRTQNIPLIVDAVSAFPYYNFPGTADVTILSSSKQLRGLPVLGIVAYREELEEGFEKTNSYLDLSKAIEYGKKGQTPHTSLIPQVHSLWKSLIEKSWEPYVSNIGMNAMTVGEQLDDVLVGEKVAPVLTIQTKDANEVVRRLSRLGLDVYYNPAYSGNRIQVSCFNYGTLPYDELNEALLGLGEDGLL